MKRSASRGAQLVPIGFPIVGDNIEINPKFVRCLQPADPVYFTTIAGRDMRRCYCYASYLLTKHTTYNFAHQCFSVAGDFFRFLSPFDRVLTIKVGKRWRCGGLLI